MKKILCLLLVFTLSAMLIGCTAEETQLWNAYKKTADCKSCAMDMTLKITADTSAVTDENLVKSLSNLNDATFNIMGKITTDKDTGAFNGSFDVKANYKLISMNYKLWIVADPATNNYKEIIEFPEIYKLAMPNAKQYNYIDLSEILSKAGLNTSILSAGPVGSIEEIDTTGIKVENRDGLYYVTAANKSFNSIFKQYINTILSSHALTALNTNEIDKFSAINLLNGKDFEAKMSINNQGYIEELNYALSLVISPAQISEALGNPYKGAAAENLVFGLDYKCKYTQYNTVTDVEVPVLTAENSANMINSEKNNSNEISVVVNGRPVKFDVPPQSVNDRTMVPMRAIFEALGASVDYNDGVVTAISGDKTITHTIGDKIIYVNDKALETDVPSFETNGRTLVPARFISEALGADVKWIEETKTVQITLK